jgi:SAM-dependent methyltransferase
MDNSSTTGENQRLESFVNMLLRDRKPSVLLEAGCGSVDHIKLNNIQTAIGIDLSFSRLKRHPFVQEKVVGDLQRYPFKEQSFDMIVCWDVLEHLSNPSHLLIDFYHSLRKNGILVLAFPNLLSWKGLVTKLTPYWIHECFYRQIFGDKRQEDFDQFPTYLRNTMEPNHLRHYSKSIGFSERYCRLYEGPVQSNLRGLSGILDLLFHLAGSASRLLSLGRIDLNMSDCIMVLMKE